MGTGVMPSTSAAVQMPELRIQYIDQALVAQRAPDGVFVRRGRRGSDIVQIIIVGPRDLTDDQYVDTVCEYLSLRVETDGERSSQSLSEYGGMCTGREFYSILRTLAFAHRNHLNGWHATYNWDQDAAADRYHA